MSRQVTGRTGLLCLLGSPVAHSISPAMHNEACALLDLDYTYLAFDEAPDRLAEAVEGLKALGVRGFNVTMPHKTAAAAGLHRSASMILPVQTVFTWLVVSVHSLVQQC